MAQGPGFDPSTAFRRNGREKNGGEGKGTEGRGGKLGTNHVEIQGPKAYQEKLKYKNTEVLSP
jgi:hypothetical protein